MTCIDKLRAMHPEWDEEHILRKIKYSCPSEFNIADDPETCPMCDHCWEREATVEIPHEFEYLSKCMIYDKDGERKMRNERVWVTKVGQMHKHHYTGKPYFRLRTESQSGGVWEGWVTEEDIREMMEEKVK